MADITSTKLVEDMIDVDQRQNGGAEDQEHLYTPLAAHITWPAERMNSQIERNKLLEAAFTAFALEIAFVLVIVLIIALLKTAF